MGDQRAEELVEVPRQVDVNLLASFPAVGDVPTIVIGQPENTAAKTSTRWVLTLLHEHFHQMQFTLPDYYPGVNALGLARGIEQGSWTVKLADAQRSAFYPVGAAEGILLDRVNPGWRRPYSSAGFTLDGQLGGM